MRSISYTSDFQGLAQQAILYDLPFKEHFRCGTHKSVVRIKNLFLPKILFSQLIGVLL